MNLDLISINENYKIGFGSYSNHETIHLIFVGIAHILSLAVECIVSDTYGTCSH